MLRKIAVFGLVVLLVGCAGKQEPPFIGKPQGEKTKIVVTEQAHEQLKSLWAISQQQDQEQVACLDASIASGPVWTLEGIKMLEQAAPTKNNRYIPREGVDVLKECAAPDFVGTVHTHPAPSDSVPMPDGSWKNGPFKEFSRSDRSTQEAWGSFWGDRLPHKLTLWCIVYSKEMMRCQTRPVLPSRERWSPMKRGV